MLWIVWDTARADHMSLYGYERPTTPFLDEWAKGARVFDDCLSAAGYTLPSHASMFTGLLPSEHCAHNGTGRLDSSFTTIAELLKQAGYRTYLYSANPHISETGNFNQGFDRAEHPWSPPFVERAIALVRDKLVPEDRSSELGRQFDAAGRHEGHLSTWNIKAAGKLAQDATLAWLRSTDDKRPYFAFLNYMEAHRPYIPPRRLRERVMSEDEVARSYTVDRSWLSLWEYTFGLREYSDEELALTRATYDATLLELDELLRDLLSALEREGFLENTVVVLTSDHGEHLGEQHMLDHQYSLYQPVLRVPLVVRYPERFPAGHESRPVVNFDLFPTLLELARVEPPHGASRAVSLLHPLAARARLAEEPASSEAGLATVKARHPEWDPSPWQRGLRAWVEGPHKLIRGSDGRRELYDLATDPLERHDVASERAGELAPLESALSAYCDGLAPCPPSVPGGRVLSPQEHEMLRGLGYVD